MPSAIWLRIEFSVQRKSTDFFNIESIHSLSTDRGRVLLLRCIDSRPRRTKVLLLKEQ